MATMNEAQFTREATTTVLNHISTTGRNLIGETWDWPAPSEDEKKELEDGLAGLFRILEADGFYVGRRGYRP